MDYFEDSYYIGIDGGATKTLVALGDNLGTMIEVIKLGATNYHAMGVETTKDTLKEALDTITRNNKIGIAQIKKICFGGAGIDTDEGVKIMTNIFRDIGYKNELTIVNDSLIALVGANDGYHGGVVIGGTGSVAIGVDDDGKTHKVGGWGHILDDRGSGYAIARDALYRIMSYHDGRGRETLLWDGVKERLKIESPEEISDFVYDSQTKKHDIADLATIVIGLYDKDEVATEIIEEAVASLQRLIVTLAKNIGKDRFSMALYGSIIVKNDKFRERLTELVNEQYPNIKLHLPLKEAYRGALNIATGKVKID